MAFTRANRSATGSAARTNPTRSPPQKRLLSEPTTAPGWSGRWTAIGGGAASHVSPARAWSSTSGTRASASTSAISARRPAASTAPVGLCSVGCR